MLSLPPPPSEISLAHSYTYPRTSPSPIRALARSYTYPCTSAFMHLSVHARSRRRKWSSTVAVACRARWRERNLPCSFILDALLNQADTTTMLPIHADAHTSHASRRIFACTQQNQKAPNVCTPTALYDGYIQKGEITEISQKKLQTF